MGRPADGVTRANPAPAQPDTLASLTLQGLCFPVAQIRSFRTFSGPEAGGTGDNKTEKCLPHVDKAVLRPINTRGRGRSPG